MDVRMRAYHDNAGSAKAALTAIALCYPFLHWMRPLDRADTFDCDDMLPVDTHERSETCVHRSVVDLVGGGVELGDYHSAGSAASFRTAQLCSRQPYPSEILQEGDFRVSIVQDYLRSIEVEANRVIVSLGHAAEGGQCIL